jgi:hypothetical protein
VAGILIVAVRLQTTPAVSIFMLQRVNLIIVQNKLPGLLTPPRIVFQTTRQERCRRCPYKSGRITQGLKQTNISGNYGGAFSCDDGKTERRSLGEKNGTCLEYIPTSDYSHNPVTNFIEALPSEYTLNEFEIHKTGRRHNYYFFHHGIFFGRNQYCLTNQRSLFKLRHIKYPQLILNELLKILW